MYPFVALVAADKSWQTNPLVAAVTVPKGMVVEVEPALDVPPAHELEDATAFTVKLKVASTVSDRVEPLVLINWTMALSIGEVAQSTLLKVAIL